MGLTNLQKYVENGLHEWIHTPENQDIYYNQPIKYFKEYVENTAPITTVSGQIERLENFFITKYEYFALFERVNYEYFALETLYAIWKYKIGYGLGKFFPGKLIFLETLYCITISQCWMLGWIKSADELGDILLKEITGEHFQGIGDDRLCPWFIIELYCRSKGIPLNKSGTIYPKDLKIYKHVLDNWNISNNVLVDEMVTKMCDYHIENAADDDESEFNQFHYLIFPVEILGWLSLRSALGLENPTKYSHPLMQIPMNQLPTPVAMPTDVLLEQAVAKIKEQFPSIVFEAHS